MYLIVQSNKIKITDAEVRDQSLFIGRFLTGLTSLDIGRIPDQLPMHFADVINVHL